MRLSARTIAAMLIGLAFAAAQPEANSQSRGNSRSSSTSRTTTTRQSSSSSKSSDSKTKSADRPAAKPATKPATKPASTPATKPATKPSGNSGSSVSRPTNTTSRPKVDISPADRKPANSKPNVNKPSGHKPPQPATKPATKPSAKPAPHPDRPSGNRPSANRPKPGHNPGFKPGNADRPIGVRPPSRPSRPPRVHPRDRNFMDYNRVTIHWSSNPHYYGYRIQTLPASALRRLIGGVTYYVYNDIWYRPYNGYYIVSRPPFGTSLAANIINDIAWTAVTLSYYNTVANTYDTISENNAYIAQQNAVIAQNNATIAAQNQAIAQSQSKAQVAYGLANELGLVQSYGSASASYFYQDGVFYSQGSDGQYYVIVPPAGAVVDRLPEDFDTVILNGNKYYRVDDTIYQMVINEGKPYFEVLGQMN